MKLRKEMWTTEMGPWIIGAYIVASAAEPDLVELPWEHIQLRRGPGVEP